MVFLVDKVIVVKTFRRKIKWTARPKNYSVNAFALNCDINCLSSHQQALALPRIVCFLIETGYVFKWSTPSCAQLHDIFCREGQNLSHAGEQGVAMGVPNYLNGGICIFCNPTEIEIYLIAKFLPTICFLVSRQRRIVLISEH